MLKGKMLESTLIIRKIHNIEKKSVGINTYNNNGENTFSQTQPIEHHDFGINDHLIS